MDVIMSTDDLDSYGERVDQSGFILDRFRKNPILLAFHDSRTLPIGRCENVRVEAGALQCRVVFASAKANPEAEKIFRLIQEKILNAVSIGMIVHDYEDVMEGDQQVRILRKCEIAELSIVCVPANAEALIKRAAREKQLSEARAAAALNTPTSGEQDTQNMDQKDIDALKAEHEKALKAERDGAIELAAQVRAIGAERDSLKAELDAKTKAFDALTSLRDGLAAELASTKAALTERDADLAKARESIVTTEVDALVGVKFAPAQRDAFLALAKSDKKAFDSIVAATPDMGLLQRAIPATGDAPTAAKPDEALAEYLNKATADDSQVLAVLGVV